MRVPAAIAATLILAIPAKSDAHSSCTRKCKARIAHKACSQGYNVGRCWHVGQGQARRHRVDCDLVTYRPGEQTFWVAHVRRTDGRRITTATSLTYVKTVAHGQPGGH